MPENNMGCGCPSESRNCGCGLFNGCGGDSEILFFIIIFYSLTLDAVDAVDKEETNIKKLIR